MAAITGGTNGKRPVTEPAGLLAKRYVHVGAAAHSDWTCGRNRDTTSSDPSRSVGASRRSPRVWRGKAPGPHLIRRPLSLRHVPRPHREPEQKRLWTLTQPWTHRTRPRLLGNLA